MDGMDGSEESDEGSRTNNENEFRYAATSERSLQEQVELVFCPTRVVIVEALPLYLCFAALVLTFAGSWTCTYFEGAEMSFTGGMYGLWSVEDANGKCQLWDVLFFSYQWDSYLEGARFNSMIAMLLGFAMFVTMLQAQQAHYLSWAVAFTIIVLFIVSAATSSIFNIWCIFWLSTFVIYTLIVRSLLLHPVHRRISKRGTLYIALSLFICFLTSLMTLLVLQSDYCSCEIITTRDLEDRQRDETCTDSEQGNCRLSASGYMMIVASMFWLASAVSAYAVGVQPSSAQEDPAKVKLKYSGYSRESITTKTLNLMRGGFKTSKHSGTSTNEPAAGDDMVSVENDDSLANKEVQVTDLVLVQSLDSVGNHHSGSSGDDHGNDASIDIADNGDDNDDDSPIRTRCQRCCCDFRVTPRTTKEKRMFWSFRVVLGFMLVFYFFLIILLIGSRVENHNAEEAPSTRKFFITEEVCAFDPGTESFQTFPSPGHAKALNFTIAHCGACANCSNMPDIRKYILTRKTVAKTAKRCKFQALFGTYSELVDCLREKIGFSVACTNCWADNMRTTVDECLFTCTKTLFTGLMTHNNVPGAGDSGWLNHCLHCDEKMSGPAFVTCSGVARRRLGIVSEIERNPDEQCPYVDLDWVNYFPN